MMRDTTAPSAATDTQTARKAMIDSQLRTSGINEEFVLARMMHVAREAFLPAEKAPLAYIDRSVGLEEGGALAAPLFYGKLLIEAAPRADDRVLIVENGTGYLGALTEPLVEQVSTVSVSDAACGNLPDAQPFSLILVDGAIEQLPTALAELIADDGRIVSGLVLRSVTRLAAGRKVAGQVSLLPVEDLGIPILSAFAVPKKWSFS